MELKEYYKILKANFSVIVTTALIFALATYAWYVRESQKYSAELLLGIGRISSQNTSDYRYDQYYQVQADEKFSSTVVGWLKFPGVSSEVFDKSGIKEQPTIMSQLSKSFDAELVSPELVSVKYSTASEEDAKKIATAIQAVVDEKIGEINAQAKDQTWFKVYSQNFIVLKNSLSLALYLGIALSAGIIVGSFLTLLRHYLSES